MGDFQRSRSLDQSSNIFIEIVFLLIFICIIFDCSATDHSFLFSYGRILQGLWCAQNSQKNKLVCLRALGDGNVYVCSFLLGLIIISYQCKLVITYIYIHKFVYIVTILYAELNLNWNDICKIWYVKQNMKCIGKWNFCTLYLRMLGLLSMFARAWFVEYVCGYFLVHSVCACFLHNVDLPLFIFFFLF